MNINKYITQNRNINNANHLQVLHFLTVLIQVEFLVRGHKLWSINNWDKILKFIYSYLERCKRGPAHNRFWNWSPLISKHISKCFSKFWNTFPQNVKVDGLNVYAYSNFDLFDCAGCGFVHFVRGVDMYTLPSIMPQRKKSAGVISASTCL